MLSVCGAVYVAVGGSRSTAHTKSPPSASLPVKPKRWSGFKGLKKAFGKMETKKVACHRLSF